MSKQDRQGARTPAQLEQEFQFGKKFAEAMGLAQDANEEAEKAKEAIDTLDKDLDHEEIFNRLTKDGELLGLYRENGNIYINASFVKSGILLADLVKAGVLKSKDGETFYLDLDNGILKGKFAELKIDGKTVDEIAEDKAKDAVGDLSQVDVFNKLTNNGALKGVYMENGDLYINASYLKSGTIDASIIKVINLIAEKLSSTNGASSLTVSGAELEMRYNGKETFYISNEFGNSAQIGFSEYDSEGNLQAAAFMNASQVELGGAGIGDRMYIGVNRDNGKPYIALPNGSNHYLYWEDAGNGAYTLMGSDYENPKERRYTKTLDLGNAGATTSNWKTLSFPHGVSGIDKIIRCEGYITGAKATTLPAINGGLVMVWADKTNVYLYREIAYTPQSDERLYVQLWYTK